MRKEFIINSTKCPGVAPEMSERPENILVREHREDGSMYVHCVWLDSKKKCLIRGPENNDCIQLNPITSDPATYTTS